MTSENTNKELTVVTRIFSEIMKDDRLRIKEKNLQHRFNPDLRLLSVRSVSVTPDNKYLIITHEYTSQIKVIDLSKMELMPFKYDSHSMTVRLVSPAMDSTSFYTASWDGCFKHFNILTGKHELLFCGTRSPSVFLDPREKYLFTAEYPDDFESGYNIGRCWDLHTKRTVVKYIMNRNHFFPESIDIAYDQNFVYVGCDGTVMKFNLFDKKPLLKYFEANCGIRKVAVSESFMAAASNDGILRIYRKNGEFYRHIEVSKSQIMDVRIAKNESFVVCGDSGGNVNCWSLVTGERKFSIQAHKAMIWSLCLANSDKLIICGATDGLINFINAESGKIILQFYNLRRDNEILISVPQDINFPDGYFYTSNKDFIDVYMEDKNDKFDLLDFNDKKRLSYINKLNCKNLIIRKLKNINQYDTMMNNFSKEIIGNFSFQNKLPGALNSAD